MNKIIKKILIKIPFLKKQINKINILIQKNKELEDILINEKENRDKISLEKEKLDFELKKIKKEENNIKNKLFYLNQKKYLYVVEKIKKRVKKGKKIRVCFFIMYDGSFSYKPLYEKMLSDDSFEPFIVIIPDTSRGEDHLIFSLENAYNNLSKKYKKVYKGYDYKLKKINDFSRKTDLVCFPTPYEGMSLKNFEMEYFLKKDILTFYVNYAYSVLKFVREVTMIDSYSLYWKVFVENKHNIKELNKYEKIKGKNAIVSGYCKMDDLYNQKIRKRKRKVIIIAPHHTVSDWKLLKISNFLKYAEFFLKLPKLYPQIDFIFRPHPLLIVQLKKPEVWGIKKTNKYFEKMESYPNVLYSRGGEYFDMFVNSDGIIHDCGSFLAEYLFTEKPACYMLENKKSIKKWFLPIGQKCLDFCYKTYSEKDIINFIENVILKNKDVLREKRISFVNSNLKLNYPNSSKFILNFIKKELL